MADNNSTSGGIGLSGALFLIFLVLKLTAIGVVAKWSWWWITSPLWIPVLILIAIYVIAGMAWVFLKIYNRTINRKKFNEANELMKIREKENSNLKSIWQKRLQEMKNRND